MADYCAGWTLQGRVRLGVRVVHQCWNKTKCFLALAYPPCLLFLFPFPTFPDSRGDRSGPPHSPCLFVPSGLSWSAVVTKGRCRRWCLPWRPASAPPSRLAGRCRMPHRMLCRRMCLSIHVRPGPGHEINTLGPRLRLLAQVVFLWSSHVGSPVWSSWVTCRSRLGSCTGPWPFTWSRSCSCVSETSSAADNCSLYA